MLAVAQATASCGSAPAIARACADASKPRKKDRAPLVIEAGTPLDNPPPARAYD